MIINGKKIFKSITHKSHIVVNETKNKIDMVDKEFIKKELFYELLKKYNGNEAEVVSIINDEYKKIILKIETVYTEYNPHKPSELYEEGGFYYYNFFKNTPVRKKMLEIYEEHKKRGTLKNDVLAIVEKFPFVNYVFDSLTNYNKNYKKYLLNWLAFVFITHKKTQNTIILKGIEGTGKGLLFEHIIQKVFYNNQTTVISNDELNNVFNEFIENRSFIVANEVQDYTNKKSVYEKLKQWISDTTILLNVKHQNMRNIENKANFLIYSNNENPIPLTATDRRYSVINTTDVKLADTCKKDLGVDIIKFVEKFKEETEPFLYELAKFNFSEKQAKQLLKTKERDTLILNTEEKTKILKHKLKTLDKNFFLEDFVAEYLFDINENDYFHITEKLGLGKIKDGTETWGDRNIEETHKIIITELFEAIETKSFVPFSHIKYLLYFMYYETKDLKELNKYASKIGEKTKKPIWFRGKTRKGIIIKPISITKDYNKNDEIVQLTKTEYEELLNKIKQLEKENEELKQQIPF